MTSKTEVLSSKASPSKEDSMDRGVHVISKGCPINNVFLKRRDKFFYKREAYNTIDIRFYFKAFRLIKTYQVWFKCKVRVCYEECAAKLPPCGSNDQSNLYTNGNEHGENYGSHSQFSKPYEEPYEKNQYEENSQIFESSSSNGDHNKAYHRLSPPESYNPNEFDRPDHYETYPLHSSNTDTSYGGENGHYPPESSQKEEYVKIVKPYVPSESEFIDISKGYNGKGENKYYHYSFGETDNAGDNRRRRSMAENSTVAYAQRKLSLSEFIDRLKLWEQNIRGKEMIIDLYQLVDINDDQPALKIVQMPFT